MAVGKSTIGKAQGHGDGGAGFHGYEGGTSYHSGDGYRGGGDTSYGHRQSNYNNPYVYHKDTTSGFSSHSSYDNRGNFDGRDRGSQGRTKTVTFKDSFANFGSDQNRFGALDDAADQTTHFGQGTKSNDFDPNEILVAIKHDMEEWEGSKFWPLSSYKPNKSQGSIPGLEDISQEEVRFITYAADKENKFDQFKALFAAIIDSYHQKRDILKKPPSDVASQLVGTYRGRPGTGSIFGDNSSAVEMLYNCSAASSGASQAFASSGFANPSSGFDSTSTSSSAFSSTFGSATPGSSFGQNGSSTGSGLFGKPVTSESSGTGLFGKPATSSGGGAGLFGKGATSHVTTADGGSSGIFGNSGSSSGLFGNSGSSSGLFGNSGSSSGIFGSSSNTSNTGLFGKPAPSTNSQPGLFGKPQQNDSASSSSTSSSTKRIVYTPLSELTPEEKEEFEAASFTLGKVPMRPPPMELCR